VASTVSASSTTGSASVQYQFTDAFMTYLSWSEGFKSGGFNQRYNAAPPGNAPISFNPETAESWEVGFKMDPADTLRMNVALFTTDYDDIQMTYRLGVVPLLFNAGVASITGGELELEYAPTAAFRLDGSLGYLCDAGNSREIAQLEGITLVNASLTLASEDSRWRFVLSGNNLTDEEYPVAGTSSLTTASGYAEIIYSRPLTVALSAAFSF
jgi:outer membrane receptor protein involved in Fe transport